MPALYEILLREHLKCWQHFVLACRILCKHQLSQSDIDLFDVLLIRFCQHAQALYGDNFITPNMHMHAHLKSVVEDYAPVFGFWLFSFERYNGILSNQSNNHRDIESQLNRFFRDNFHACIYIIRIHASCLGREGLNLNQFLLTFGWPCYAWPWHAAMYTRPWAS